jgi:hypothetical protein
MATPEFFFPGTFDEEPPEISPDETSFHQGGLDGIDPAYDAVHRNLLTGAIGFDPLDLYQPSSETQESIEKGLPQWGPPFVKFVDDRLSHLEELVQKATLKWSFETQTYVSVASVQTTAAGGLDQISTPNCIIFSTPPGFTFALHRLTINILNGTNNFGTPFNAAASYWELRVGNDMIDGASMVSPSAGLPTKLTYGTRDAPRCRDGEIMSLFMVNGPASTRIQMKIQGSMDRTIEG